METETKNKYRPGWYSTKLHLALITMALITSVYGFMGFPVAAFGEYCFSVTTAAGIYSGTRVAETFAQRNRSGRSQPVSGGEPPRGE